MTNSLLGDRHNWRQTQESAAGVRNPQKPSRGSKPKYRSTKSKAEVKGNSFDTAGVIKTVLSVYTILISLSLCTYVSHRGSHLFETCII